MRGNQQHDRRELLDRIQRVVDFAQSDDRHAGQHLRRLLFGSLPGWLVPSDLATADARAIRDELLSLLNAAITGERHRVSVQIARQIWRDARVSKDVMISTSSPLTRDLVLYQTTELLRRVGVNNLRSCPAPKQDGICGRLFIKVTKKEFCSKKCQARVWARARRAEEAQERKVKIHAKTTRTRRR